jgi:hypothetical protein
MMMPFDWAVLSIEEAKLLMEYIEKSTATKTQKKYYEKIQRLGMLPIYQKLREFVELHNQYKALQTLDIGSLATLTDLER